MENALDAAKKNIFKSIAELTLLKKSAVVPPDPRVVPIPQAVLILESHPPYELYLDATKHLALS